MTMETKEYTTVDKSAWGEGAWQNEPDKKQWMDKETGMPCLIVRNCMGALCGYVGVTRSHPAFGLNYDGHTEKSAKERMRRFRKESRWRAKRGYDFSKKCPRLKRVPESKVYGKVGERIYDIEVHGGLTFAGLCQHGNEATGICHTDTQVVHWFGFDCNHAWDIAPKMRLDIASLGLPKLPSFRDDEVYRDVPYVTAQVEKLAKQLKAIA